MKLNKQQKLQLGNADTQLPSFFKEGKTSVAVRQLILGWCDLLHSIFMCDHAVVNRAGAAPGYKCVTAMRSM